MRHDMTFGPIDDVKRGSAAAPPWRVEELTFDNAGEGLIHPYACLFTIADYWPYGYFTSRRRCELPGKLFRARASGADGDRHHFLAPAFWGAVNRFRMVDGQLHYAWRVRVPQRRVAGGRFSYVCPSQGPWEIWCNRDENDTVVWTLRLLDGGSWTTRTLPFRPGVGDWMDVRIIADPQQLSLLLDQQPVVTYGHDAYAQPFYVQFGSSQVQADGEEVVSDFRHVYLDVLPYPDSGVEFDEGPEDLRPGDDAIVGYFQVATPDAPRASEGDMVVLKDGRLLCVYGHYHAGEGWDLSPAHLVASTSEDGGRTWSQPRQMIGMEEGSVDNVMLVSLLRAHNDDLLIAYADQTPAMQARGMMLRRSSDDGRTWSARQPITPDSNNVHQANNACLVALRCGRIVLAMREYIDGVRWPYALFSDDDGRTWHAGRHVPDPELTDEQRDGQNVNEPSICELADGRLLMTMRSIAGGQFFSWSSDRGETWTKPVLSPLRGACSPAIVRRIPASEDVLALFTYHYGNRTRLLSAISGDGGLTWRHLKRIEWSEYHGYGYASCIFVGDRVLCGYMHSPSYESLFRFEAQPGYIDGRFASLPLSWFYRDVEDHDAPHHIHRA